MPSSYRGKKARFRRRKLQTGLLKYPDAPVLVNTREMKHRHLSMKGSFHYHERLMSRYLDYYRDCIVYLPPSYETTYKNYPVLYMQDGNNLFDPATGFMGREWKLDEALERLFETDSIPEMIVVGIYNSPGRMDEYTCHRHNYSGRDCGGKGHDYARFVVEELKPLIDQTYRTLPQVQYTSIMGSSLGALASFYTAQQYPETFSRIGMLSPTIYWAGHQILKDTESFPAHFKLWVDIGTEEGRNRNTEETVESTQLFIKALEAVGYQQPHNLGFYVDYMMGHDEHAWANRIELPLRYLFG